MSKFTKVCMILFGICLAAAIGCIIGSAVMGTTWKDLYVAARNGDMSIIGDYDKEEKEEEFNEFDGKYLSEDQEYKNIKNLDIDLPVGELILEDTDADTISFKVNGEEDAYKLLEEGNLLELKGKTRVRSSLAKITLYIPQNVKFDHVSVSMGAGNAEMASLRANEVDIDVDAGQIKIDLLDASDIKLDCNVGNIEVTLSDTLEQYTSDFQCSLGEIEAGEESYSGFHNRTEFGSGNKILEASCDLGRIKISETR